MTDLGQKIRARVAEAALQGEAMRVVTEVRQMEEKAPAPVARLRLISWKSVRSGSLLGFASVELPIGLRIYDCPVMNGKNGLWASLPSKPQLDRDGKKRISADGRTLYDDVLGWSERRLAEAFSERVVALVRDAHPGDLA